MKIFAKISSFLLFLALAAWLGYFFQEDFSSAWRNLNRLIRPCSEPRAYSLGEIDPRFGLTSDELKQIISQAARLWEQPLGKKLFRYGGTGGLKIDLIYDSRQDSTIKLEKLGLDIHDDQTTYEELKEKYNTIDQIFAGQKAELDKMLDYYEGRKNDYESEVKSANKRGGVTPTEFAILEYERKKLDDLLIGIKKKQETVNKTVDDLNALANVINKLIHGLNLDVGSYNTIGAQTSGEFQEGEYVSDSAGERINVYQYNDREMLIKLLAHEMGHALGLEHSEDETALMYRLNLSGQGTTTPGDLAALKDACRIK